MNIKSFYFIIAIILTYIALSCLACANNKSPQQSETAEDAKKFIESQYDTLFMNPQKALINFTEFQKTITDSIGYYEIELYKAIAHLYMDDDRAKDSIRQNVSRYFQRAEESAELYSLQTIYWNHTAVNLQTTGYIDSAITCYKNAYISSVKSKDLAGAIPVCMNLADTYRAKGDALHASAYYRRALKLSDSLNIDRELLGIYSGLGQVYTEIENYNEANKYFDKAAKIVDINDTTSANSYGNYHFLVSYGNSLYFQNRYKEALKLFLKADKIAQKINLNEFIFITQVNIGEVLLLLSQTDSAAVYLDRASSIFKEIPQDSHNRFYLNSLLGYMESERNNLVAANEYLKKASEDSAYANPRYLALHYSRLQTYYELRHNYKEAYRCMNQAKRYTDSINNQAVRNQMTEIDMRYMQDTTLLRKDLIISQKDSDVKRLQLQLIVLVIIVIVIVACSVIWYMYKRRGKILSEMKLRNMLYSQRLANMRNRISPHFVFNVLNRELAANNPGINNLVKLLRMNLEMCDRSIVPLTDEIAFIDTYIEDERPSIGENFSYNKFFAQNVNLDTTMIPSMFIHIFVENAVKHGLRGFKNDKYLNIRINRVNSAIEIKIENNGNITSTVSNNDSTGTGMRIITQTIQILNELNKRKKIEVEIDSKTDEDKQELVWTVTLTIPEGYDFSILSSK